MPEYEADHPIEPYWKALEAAARGLFEAKVAADETGETEPYEAAWNALKRLAEVRGKADESAALGGEFMAHADAWAEQLRAAQADARIKGDERDALVQALEKLCRVVQPVPPSL
jgi:hypothetical protein